MRSTTPSTSGSDQQQQTGPPPNNPFLSYYREFEERTPYVTRISMIVMIICYLLSFFFDAVMFLGNTPYFTLYSFEIYRLVTSPFVGNSIITLVLIAMFFPTMGAKFETSLGSAFFLFLMGTLTLVTNIVFVMSCFLLNLLGLVEAIFYNCSGFWVVLFGLITVECMQTPDEPRRFLMIPVDIPAKLFPLLLYAIFILLGGFSGSLFLSFGVAIVVGFFYSQGWLDKLKPTSYYLESLEVPGGPLHALSRSKGLYTITHTLLLYIYPLILAEVVATTRYCTKSPPTFNKYIPFSPNPLLCSILSNLSPFTCPLSSSETIGWILAGAAIGHDAWIAQVAYSYFTPTLTTQILPSKPQT